MFPYLKRNSIMNEDIIKNYNLDDDTIRIYNENMHLFHMLDKSKMLIRSSYIVALFPLILFMEFHHLIILSVSFLSTIIHWKGCKIKTLLNLNDTTITKIRIVDLCIQLENIYKTKDRDFRTPMQKDLYEFNKVMNILSIKSDLAHNFNKLKAD